MFNSVFNFKAALEIVNQTFVSILSGNFICICTVHLYSVFGHVGLALAAERQFTTAPVYQ